MLPTVTRSEGASSRTMNGSPGAAPMPCAANVSIAERSSATCIHRLMPSVPVNPTPAAASTAVTALRRAAYSTRAAATASMVG